MKSNSSLNIFSIIFLIWSSNLIAQSKIDSLENALKNSGGKDRVDILNILSDEYKNEDLDKARELADETISLAKTIEYKVGEASAYINSGNFYRKQGEFNKSIQEYLNALQLSQEAGDPKSIARSFNGLGIANNLLGNYDKSLEAFLNALKTYEDSGDLRGIADALNNVGIHHWSLGNLEEALNYYLRALDIRKELGGKKDIAASLNNIGLLYSNLNKPDSALHYLLDALEMEKEAGSDEVKFALYGNIGSLYDELADYQKSLSYYEAALELSEKAKDDWGEAQTYNLMGIAYLHSDDYEKAQQLFEQSLEKAKQINARKIIQDAYLNLSNLLATQGYHKKSLEYFKLHNEVKDSIFNETKSKQLAEINMKYETEKKEAEISQLTSEKALQDLQLKKSENLKWFFIMASILSISLLGGLLFGFRQKQKANLYLTERNKLEIENKNRAISLFGQQVSKEIAQELLSNSSKSSSKKLSVCIMFLDIRDFTPYVEHREPFEIIQYQNDVFGFMIDTVIKNHGIINQFLGDGFMASFGAPASAGNDCQNAINAALSIVNTLNEKCQSGHLPHTKIGIGLHAGDIVAGNVGTNERKQYSITGNTVILASRIEQLNKKFNSRILASKEVLDHAKKDELTITALGKESLKGREEALEIFQLA